MASILSTVVTRQMLLAVALVAMTAAVVNASDPDPLQDFCVADLTSGIFVNGYPCKNPLNVTTEDFTFKDFAVPAKISPKFGAGVTPGLIQNWPGLNTLGLAMARLDFNPGGVIAPHTHSLATEILFCTEGEIYTGFVTNGDNPNAPNKLFAKVVKKGEAFIFPRGLLHFQINKGTTHATSINVLNGQYPGFQDMGFALFGTSPAIDPELLAKSFFISEDRVESLQNVFTAVAVDSAAGQVPGSPAPAPTTFSPAPTPAAYSTPPY